VTPFRVATAALALSLVALVAGARRAPFAVPDFARLRGEARSSEVRFLDRRGELVHELRGDLSGRRLEWVPLAEISPVFVDTVVRIEDRRFLTHGGVDWLAALGAAGGALSGRGARGASTLTMQLATLLDPAPPAPRGSFARKLRQARAALAIERRYTKDQILEAYLNRVAFRGELRGIAAAARGLFRADPHGLDPAQSLVLAALLRAPSASAEDVAARACRLAALAPQPVTCETARAAARTALAEPPRIEARIALAPHLAHRLLAATTGAPPARVGTTLDAELQRFALEAVQRQLADLATRNARDAAVIALENATGDVLVYVGSSGERSASPRVDGVRALRQAGSTLKPFLYAAALDSRLVTPASWLEDTTLEIATPVGGYAPLDYDEGYRGLVRLRTALAASLNVPAVRTLALIGPQRLTHLLEDAGLRDLRPPEDYGASLALGSADVRLEELANAFRALANGGVASPLRFRADSAASDSARRIVSAEAAFLIGDVLSDRGSRSPTFGLESSLATPFWSAVKTGTSKDMRDNWCLGWSSDFTVGVWVGNFSGEPMWNVTGVDGAAPIWLELMRRLHRDRPSPPPAPPNGVVRREGEWFLRGTEPEVAARPAPREARAPRITSPTRGAVVALDPDVPRRSQRVFLEIDPPRADLALRIDGRFVGDAGAARAWRPVAGAHALELVDGDARVVDRVEFRVRE
jgi:penicillin-binding protein 1C